MQRIFHLSHLLDKNGYKRIDLISFYELSKLDEYISKFKDHRDVRKKYDIDIGEFCLDNRKMIEEENKKNNHNWTGSIAIVCEERDEKDQKGLIYKIPIIYQNDRNLLPKKECLEKIKNKLDNSKIMIEIYCRKKELLSQNERHLIILYQKTNKKKYLESAIGFFYNRLKRMQDDELLYFYCRDLMNICELNELTIKTKFGEIKNINYNLPSSFVLEKPEGYSKDAYFNKLISEENYEELFNMYTIDNISINSDMFDKGRKK